LRFNIITALANGRGSVLILQGLQQEGTEAAGLFLADADNRQKLQQALGVSGTPGQPYYFEALVRTQAVFGLTGNMTNTMRAMPGGPASACRMMCKA
jgi:hypothetical protein